MSQWIVIFPEQDMVGPFGDLGHRAADASLIEADSADIAIRLYAGHLSVLDCAAGFTLLVRPWEPDGVEYRVQYENPDSEWPEPGPGFGKLLIRKSGVLGDEG